MYNDHTTLYDALRTKELVEKATEYADSHGIDEDDISELLAWDGEDVKDISQIIVDAVWADRQNSALWHIFEGYKENSEYLHDDDDTARNIVQLYKAMEALDGNALWGDADDFSDIVEVIVAIDKKNGYITIHRDGGGYVVSIGDGDTDDDDTDDDDTDDDEQ